MKWNETVANKCRYGDVAEKIWGDWNVLWEDSEDNYQGHASFIAENGGDICFYEWSYGSCSGCDTWEGNGFSDEQIEKEMRDSALWFNSKNDLKTWLNMLESTSILPHGNYSGFVDGIDILSGGPLNRINAIRKYLGMKELTYEDLRNNHRNKKEKKNG